MKSKGNIFIGVFSVAAFSLFSTFYLYSRLDLPTHTTNNTYFKSINNDLYNRDVKETTNNKTHSSKYLGYSVDLNSAFVVNEKLTYTDLINDFGKINISRTGTNFDNLLDYLKDFDSKRSISIREESALKINNYDLIKRLELFHGGHIQEQKVYYTFIDSWVYALSTSSEKLYDDLDTIAKSFQYTP